MKEISGYELIPDGTYVLCEDGKWRDAHLEKGEVCVLHIRGLKTDEARIQSYRVNPDIGAVTVTQDKTYKKDELDATLR